MNILYITEKYCTHDRRFLKAIVKMVDKVFLFVMKKKENICTDIPVGVCYLNQEDISAEEISSICRKEDIDVVHAGPLHTVVPEIVERVDVPIVAMSWASDVLFYARNDHKTERSIIQSLSKVDAVIVDCDAVRHKIEKWEGSLSDRIISFPWGIDLDRFRNVDMLRSENRDISAKEFTFISTRHWEEVYGIPNLIKAFSILHKQLPFVKLALAGKGSLEVKIEKMIEQLGLEKAVVKLGRLKEEDMPETYLSADAYVSSSFCDGSSISLLEAMACKLPVIVHNDNGNVEWIENNKNGRLVDCFNPEQMASEMKWVACLSEKDREIIGQRNRQKVFEKADWKKNKLKIKEAYDLAKQVKDHIV